MTPALPLRAALKRGALVALANWPIVAAEFAAESLYKLALVVPVVGGAFMVAVLLETEVEPLFGDGLRAAADVVVSSLAAAPAALAFFLAAIGLVACGGLVLLSLVKLSTLAVLVRAEHAADDIERAPVRPATIRRAASAELGLVLGALPRFAGRATRLALISSLAYLLAFGGYLGVMAGGFRALGGSSWTAAWPLLVLLSTSTIVVTITLLNLCVDVLRVIIVHDDCGVRAALARLRAFLMTDARQVVGIFGVVAALYALAAAGAVLAAAALTLVAWVPLVGLAVVPLQAAAWLLRGLAFQYLELTARSAYLTQYRRFMDPGFPSTRNLQLA
jgi:hypothetical protein